MSNVGAGRSADGEAGEPNNCLRTDAISFNMLEKDEGEREESATALALLEKVPV